MSLLSVSANLQLEVKSANALTKMEIAALGDQASSGDGFYVQISTGSPSSSSSTASSSTSAGSNNNNNPASSPSSSSVAKTSGGGRGFWFWLFVLLLSGIGAFYCYRNMHERRSEMGFTS